MSVYKMVEVVGTSGTSVSDAIRGAVERAAVTLEDLQWFEVREIRGRIEGGEIGEYQVKLDVAFLLHAPERETGDRGTSRQDKPPKTQSRQARSLQAQAIARKGGKRASGVARSFKEQPGRGRR